MKILKILLIMGSLLTISFATSSCGNSAKHSHAEAKGKEYTSDYVCPMHCEGSGSEEAGKCPECGMDYEQNEKHNSDGHKHEDKSHDDHDGHGH